MTDAALPHDCTLRPATPADAALLAHFRVLMFQDMGAPLEDGTEAFWAAHFADAVAEGGYRAVIAELDGQAVACAGLMVFPTVPTPGDPSGRRAHIQGVYTVPEQRGRGLASAVTRAALRLAQADGIGSANLNASVMGAGVYERMGFTPAKAPEYRLNLREAAL